MLIRFSVGLSAFTATTLPSAGETATGPAGISRSGSRKKLRQNNARIQAGTANHGPASQATAAPAAANATA
jgi:hypothetical protein